MNSIIKRTFFLARLPSAHTYIIIFCTEHTMYLRLAWLGGYRENLRGLVILEILDGGICVLNKQMVSLRKINGV